MTVQVLAWLWVWRQAALAGEPCHRVTQSWERKKNSRNGHVDTCPLPFV